MAVDLNQEAIDLDQPEELEKYSVMLANLQGNILKSHGRDYAVYLFLRFSPETSSVKKWIAKFADRYLTSALRQYYEAKEWEKNNLSGHLFAGFYLSASGYVRLGFDTEKFVEIESGDGDLRGVPEIYFKKGMRDLKSIEKLNDPPVEDWEENYRQAIDAVILLADDNQERLKDVVARVKGSVSEAGEVLFREDGQVLRGAPIEPKKYGSPLEHFGFFDGISQPLFYKKDLPEEINLAGTTVKWNPSAPLKLALVKDPFTDKEDCFGSYLVFRKLEQNVKKFAEMEDALADVLTLTGDKKELAGAYIVGRFRNGVPVISSKHSNNDAVSLNNFDYRHIDPAEENKTHNKCPYHAHVRKTNPRGDFNLEAEREHWIVRRGITYGERETENGRPTMKDKPEKDVGLLFMCFQRSIPNQFGFIQANWVNQPQFPPVSEFNEIEMAETNRLVGLDPILERGSENTGGVIEQRWSLKWGEDGEEKPFHICDVVTMKGGEYFFAPSISFLRNLAETASE